MARAETARSEAFALAKDEARKLAARHPLATRATIRARRYRIADYLRQALGVAPRSEFNRLRGCVPEYDAQLDATIQARNERDAAAVVARAAMVAAGEWTGH